MPSYCEKCKSELDGAVCPVCRDSKPEPKVESKKPLWGGKKK